MSFAQPFTNYEIVDRLGSGSMGTVFKARQKHMDRVVALKVLKPSLARDKKYVDRLQREAQIVGQLNHPNIVTGYDLGAEGGYHFFVMEFVEGRSLRDLLEEWGSFSEDQVLDVATQIAKALEHAYECGIIHRDIKPANVLIDGRNRVKVTDMGLAKASTDLTLTRDGATVGTPQYISPEQARDPKAADVRSDLYSLGATLFHMATGQSPFRAESIGELISKVLHERAPSAARLNPALSDGLSLVIRKLLAKDPDLRYQTPTDLLADLDRLGRSERPAVDTEALEKDEAAETRSDSSGALASLTGGLRPWALIAAAAVGAVFTSAYFTLFTETDANIVVGAGITESMSPGQRIRALREELTIATDDRAKDQLRARLRRQVDELESRLREQLRSVPENQEGRATTILLRHEDADDLLERSVAPVWQQRFGCEPETLPALDAELGERMREPIDRFRIRLDESIRRRQARYLQQLREDLGSAEVEFDRFLTTGRFGAARAWLDGDGEAFHEGDGAPRLDDLAASLRAEVQLEREAQREVLQARLTVALADALGALAQSLESVRAQREHLLLAVAEGRVSFRRAQGLLDQMERELRELHPKPDDLGAVGAPGRAGWSELDSILFEARQRLAVLRAEQTERDARAVVDFAYRTIPAAGPGSAVRFLTRASDTGALTSLERLAEQIRILDGAARIVDEVLTRRATDPRPLLDRSGRPRRRTDDDFDHLAIPWEKLWRDAFPAGGPDADQRLGLAFWDLVAGRPAFEESAEDPVLDAEWIIALQRDVEPRVRDLAVSDDPRARMRERSLRLERLRELVEGPPDPRALSECENLLQLLGEPRGAFEPGVLSGARAVVSERRALFDKVAQVRGVLGEGAEVGLADRSEDGIEVRLGLQSRAEGAWVRTAPGRYSRVDSSGSFDTASATPLLWAAPSDDGPARAARVEFTMSVEDLRGEDWIVVSGLGASFLFYVGPRRCFAVGLDAADLPLDRERVQQSIQPGLLELLEAGGPQPLEGAVETFAMRRDGSRVTFLFREHVLARARIKEGDERAATLGFVAGGRFTVGRPTWFVPIDER